MIIMFTAALSIFYEFFGETKSSSWSTVFPDRFKWDLQWSCWPLSCFDLYDGVGTCRKPVTAVDTLATIGPLFLSHIFETSNYVPRHPDLLNLAFRRYREGIMWLTTLDDEWIVGKTLAFGFEHVLEWIEHTIVFSCTNNRQDARRSWPVRENNKPDCCC